MRSTAQRARLPQESAARAKGYSADDRARLDDLIERVDR
jgi:hypothetical protein